MYGGTDLKLAKNYVNEKINKLPINQNLPNKVLSFDGGIYSLPSDVVNGQISDVVLKGVTRTNLASQDIEDWEQGTYSFSDGSASIRSNRIRTKNFINVLPSTKYILSYNSNFQVAICEYTSDGVFITSSNWKTSPYIFTTNASTTRINIIIAYSDEALITASELTNVMLLFETGDVVYNFINGTKSTLSVRVKSVGKNLLSPNMWHPYGTRYEISITDPFKKTSNLPNTCAILPLAIDKDKAYSVVSDGVSIDGLYWYDADGYYIERTFSYINKTPPSNAKFLTINVKEISPETDLKVMIYKGTTATPYEPYKESLTYINAGEPLRSLPNGVKDEIQAIGS